MDKTIQRTEKEPHERKARLSAPERWASLTKTNTTAKFHIFAKIRLETYTYTYSLP